jgi:hypothetical protein
MIMNGDEMVTTTKRPVPAAPKAIEPKPSKPHRVTAKRAAANKQPVESNKTEAPAKSSPEPSKPNLLRAGLKALGNVRDDVVQHQSRVFEAILGIDPGQGWSGLIKRDSAAGKAAQEALGVRKFEAVFDQRVASALERLGMPSVDAFKALEREVAALRDEVAMLKSDAASGRRIAKTVQRKR